MSTLDDFINPSIAFVDFNKPMQACVQKMIDENISSVLVTDDEQRVVGIVTERDIVRKFTLLDVTDKLTRKVGSFMTRPVKFVRRDHLIEDVLKLHMNLKVRHFPILIDTDTLARNVLGMLSVTDILRFYLYKDGEEKTRNAPKELPTLPLAVFSESSAVREHYTAVFTQLRYKVSTVEDFGKFVMDSKNNPPLIFDLDSFKSMKIKSLTPAVLKYPGKLILVTGNPQTLSSFQKYLKKDRQTAALKPLDFSYINWILREHWGKKA